MNRIDHLFKEKTGKILSIYFTAGYPAPDSTVPIIRALSDYGADMIEIGIPFSDPVADGPVIQNSNAIALKNGMTVRILLSQLENIRKVTEIPLLIMSYLNPLLQYGLENFCTEIFRIGIDGTIIPDLPIEEYKKDYKPVFTHYDLKNIFLITPQTSTERIRFIDREDQGFLYVVSSRATTGIKKSFSEEQIEYFKYIRNLNLKNKLMAGFGVSNNETFEQACRFTNGAIAGSAFIKTLNEGKDIRQTTYSFIRSLRRL